MREDYESFDSSGTDDDLPPSHAVPRGGRTAGNVRFSVPAAAYSRKHGETDMEAQIHELEKEAYYSVLKAFQAQADVLTWEKESLLTEMRQELRISTEEHRELLARVNEDDTIHCIREWRQSGILNPDHAVYDRGPSPTVSASLRKQSSSHPAPSKSIGRPSPSFHVETGPRHQPASSVAKRASVSSSKSKKQKPSLPLGSSSMKSTPCVASDPTAIANVVNRPSSMATPLRLAEGAPTHPLIGRRVRTRWPDDNTFYEAVITRYDPVEGRHALVYDFGSAQETWEWVNLSEISPEDLEWIGDDPQLSSQARYDGSSGHGIKKSAAVPIPVKGRHSVKNSIKKDFPTPHSGLGNKRSRNIRIRPTDKLISEVERVLGAEHPNPREIEVAKKVLEEHDQELVDAISVLTDILDGEKEVGFRRKSSGEP